MFGEWHGAPLIELFKKERATGSGLTAEEARISGLMGSYLNYEHIENITEEHPETRPILDFLASERKEIEDMIKPWLESAEDDAIAVVYFVADSHLFEREGLLGYKFAVFLCNVLGAERVLRIADELHECPEKERLETIAAELSERGGG